MEIAPDLKRKILLFLILSLVALTGVFISRYFPGSKNDFDLAHKKQFEKVLREKEQKIQGLLEVVLASKNAKDPFITLHRLLQPELWQKEGLTIFLYRNDSLVFWSNNNVPAENSYHKDLFTSPFYHYGNGWFRVMTDSKDHLDAVAMILVKNDFPYQNEYLSNTFQNDLHCSHDGRVDTIPGAININSAEGNFLFSVVMEGNDGGISRTNMLTYTLWIVFFIFLIILIFNLYHVFDFLRDRSFLLLAAFAFDAILIRFIFFYFEIPHFLYNTELFSPYYYAATFISPSLGDLVLNSLFWLTLAWIFFNNCKTSLVRFGTKVKILISTAIGLFAGVLFFLLILTIKRMVIDSNIELNLNNLFNVDLYSGLGFLALISLVMAYFLVTSRLIALIFSGNIKRWHYFIIALASSLMVLFLFSREFKSLSSIVYPAFLLVYLLSFLYFERKVHGYKNISGVLFYILLFSMVATVVLDIYYGLKEKETRKVVASEFSSKRDPLIEFEFFRISDEISADSSMLRMIRQWKFNKDIESEVNIFINENYLGSFRDKYDLQVTVCGKEDVLNIQPGGYLENCYSYFRSLYRLPGNEKISDQLYFINDKMGSSNYISELTFNPWIEDQTDSVKIYIEIFQKYISETGLGYPDLLIDKKIKLLSGLGDYSYARYFNNELIYKNGDFSYNLGFQAYEKNGGISYFVDYEGYNHYIVSSEPGNALIISKKNITLLDLIAPFSYLFILFSLFLLIFLAGYIASEGIDKIEFNFSNQLQVSIITIIIISFFILGIITRANIIHLYNNKNKDNLTEKTFSVLTELEHKLGTAPDLTPDMQEYISEMLYKFSVIFYSDINIYDTRGTLIASSRPQIFNEKLLSLKMNSSAFHKLTVVQSLLLLQNEKIGEQEYLSAYIPFRNNEDQIIAYLNLPYFAKQTELRKEIGDFLAAYINVYVLLIVLAIVVTIMVSRFISRPLQLIRQKLSDTRLGKSNEKIDWRRKDEIGKLVEEYNLMIDELARSAELLARSERESAWREMAKQVAHEIKNPLTPMKLSVQYLQKAWDEKAPDWEKHLARFTNTIVEQIDSLSQIASEFSDFAKMPAANIEKVELSEVVESAADLYHHHSHISIAINKPEHPSYVMADRKQLLRVFNNLVQNAVQAIGKKSGGRIIIDITAEDEFYNIRIFDNGTGITEEQAGKIFSPSFTTKTSGMGLGLALSKSILNSLNATIDFESEPGSGTTFRIKIPTGKNYASGH
jgi:signal transduction histidine kinase